MIYVVLIKSQVSMVTSYWLEPFANNYAWLELNDSHKSIKKTYIIVLSIMGLKTLSEIVHVYCMFWM